MCIYIYIYDAYILSSSMCDTQHNKDMRTSDLFGTQYMKYYIGRF